MSKPSFFTGTQCSPSWIASANTNVGNGKMTADKSLPACQQSCFLDPACIGLDWNPSNPDGECWLTGPWSGTRFDGTSIGITHYDLTRNCGRMLTIALLR